MAGWDYWRGTLEAASAQAQAAASQASKFAEVVSAQVSEQSRVLAAQAAQRATELSAAAAEGTSGARAQLAGMNLSDALANLKLPAGDAGETQPSAKQLERHAISADFPAFVRGLTYSTFRDFPQAELDRLVAAQQAANGCVQDGAGGAEAAALNPWQARHAMLICLAVKEMNELRFVLVPKFLTDEQFWAIYFALTRSRLPPEAFDVSLQRELGPEPGTESQAEQKTRLFKAVPAERLQQETVVLGTLQSKFHQLQESARGISIPEDLKHNLSANLGGMQKFVGDLVPGGRGPSSGAAQSSDAADASASASPAAAPSPAAVRGNGGANGDALAASPAASPAATAAGLQTDPAAAAGAGYGGDVPASEVGGAALPRPSDGEEAAELDADPDLEAYLKEMAGSDDGDHDNEDANSAASLDDGEYDKYLADLGHESAGGSDAGSDAGSGEEVELDLDEYLKAVGSGDDAEGEPAAEASSTVQHAASS